jgi:hypothetical protein
MSRSDVIKNPERTKKKSTPRYPPSKCPPWKSSTAATAAPRAPSSASMCGIAERALIERGYWHYLAGD